MDEGIKKEFRGEARIGRVMKNIAAISLKPEDLSNPIAMQMAFSRIYEAMMKIIEEGGPKPTYVAEIRFTDDLGNNVVFAVDLGSELPPFSRDKVKARIIVEVFEEED
ncbi:MAG: hypothetical protein GSR72_07685 [Desulfurococcales archaeon]|nr:hypothetical protein [Desulfurococcales archaeon]MEB3789753.1 hypothetical protein [Desulfurococcales archaeon]